MNETPYLHPPTCQHGATVGDCYKCSSDPYIRLHGFLEPGEVRHEPGGCEKCKGEMSKSEMYDADYFLRGKETGKSLYENYRWIPELTIPMCEIITKHVGISQSDSILDFGCARGYVVKALRHLGYHAYGYDVSKWALENADPDTKEFLTNADAIYDIYSSRGYDWIIAKDVLEHVEYVQLYINKLMEIARHGLFVVVPLSRFDGGKYIIEDYEKDITHIQRFTLPTWVKMFIRPGWSVETSYRIKGVKDNYYREGTNWEWGNGFITARRTDRG